jgi:3-oxoacid CoA-transferase B subunit
VPAAMCAEHTIAEVENLYTLGELDPNAIHTSGIFIRSVVRANLEYCVQRRRSSMSDAKKTIAARAAAELRDGQIINLGIGLPTLITKYVPGDVDVVIQTENGAVGVGPAPAEGCEDRDRANAGNQAITLLPGGSYFDSATSFAMIRGGHVDATFLGTLQVDGDGNIANWIVPGKMLAGMGGAMDLVTGARTVYILTEHCDKDGGTKLMKRCTFPLTGAGECDVIITERGLFRRHDSGRFILEEVAAGYTLDDIAACTDMDYDVADAVRLEAYGGD